MPRVVTYGRQPTEAPAGNFKEVVFPQLALLDKGTSEGFVSRILTSEGADTRSLPRTIYYQEKQAGGHYESYAAGSLWEITADGEAGVMSGKGWFADDEWGHKAAFAVMSKKLYTNSVDLAEVTMRIEEHGDFWDDDFSVELFFDEYKVGATTLVGMPAFADAHALVDEEIMAAFEGHDGPLVVEITGTPDGHTAVEMTAAANGLPSHDYFVRPEADIPHKIIVGAPDEDGWIPIYGHLAKWNTPHTGYNGEKKYAPRSRDNYAVFCQPGVLTDKGQVNTGPIVLFGGHVSLAAAADDPRNAWADVTVTDGKHGPWVCGVVRPHIAEDMAKTYIARASRLSGHWKKDTLRMIISCSAEGFPVAQTADDYDLVASFVDSSPPPALLSFSELDEAGQRTVKEWVKEALAARDQPLPEPVAQLFSGTQTYELNATPSTFSLPWTDTSVTVGPNTYTITETTTTEITIEMDDEFDAELARLARERDLALMDDLS